ncbi:MAG TPA: RNase adapter RapZ [Gammaproteobacteria bacterium]|nr:RNase adapter RapZ [Gammaproteobacteria bacterium]
MRLLIVSGRSGSGKTVTLNMLGDLGFYCVDNLPVDLLPTLKEKLEENQPRLAVSIDSRNLPNNVNQLKKVLDHFKEPPGQLEIIYLDAQDNVLLERFSETRRRHPLTNNKVTLKEAIVKERTLLRPISNMADLTIDTTKLSQHQLCAMIRERVGERNTGGMQVLFQSFGFKNGIPADADYVFDVRCLPNPYWEPNLRKLTGLDKEVITFLENQKAVQTMIEDISIYLSHWIPHFAHDNRSYLTIAIGCTGGQHRSVYVSEALLKIATQLNYHVQIRHRDL